MAGVNKVINNNNRVSSTDQLNNRMAANKPSSTRHQNTLSRHASVKKWEKKHLILTLVYRQNKKKIVFDVQATSILHKHKALIFVPTSAWFVHLIHIAQLGDATLITFVPHRWETISYFYSLGL